MPKKPLKIPTEKEWGNEWRADMDATYAHKMFFGRSNEEMQLHFHRNPIERTADLRWMPPIPFRYYMIGFANYMHSVKTDECDAASCFLGLIEQKLTKQPEYILPIMRDLFPTIEYVATHQTAFKASEHIYGNFLHKLETIKNLYEEKKRPSDE